MKAKKFILHLSLLPFLTISTISFSQDKVAQDEKEESSRQIKENISQANEADRLNDLLSTLESIKTGDPIIDGIVERYTKYIREALASTRGLQETVFVEVNKLIEASIDYIDTDHFNNLTPAQQKSYKTWQDKSMRSLLNMVVLSSDEGTIDNEKAFQSIEPRLIELQKILIKIQESKSEAAQNLRINQFDAIANDTSSDYQLLRRFNAGAGLTYNYLPNLKYTGVISPDLERYLPLVNAGSGNTYGSALERLGEFEQSFSNTAYPSLTLSAKMGFLSASVGLPFYDSTKTVAASDSFAVLTETNQRLIAKNTVETEFTPVFDANISLSVFDLYEVIRDHYFTADWTRLGTKLSHQLDVGFVFGMSGFKLTDTYTSDIRMVNQGVSFNDSEAVDTVTSKVERNLRPLSYGVYIRLKPSDTIMLGFDFKYFENDTDGNFAVDVDGVAVTANFTYYFL